MFKLLIVDDEGFVRNGLIKNISWGDLGISAIEQADDGVNALNIATIFKPDIVLSDIRMSNMDGIELAENLKKILTACKIIFMSAYSDKEYLKSAINLKVISYVEKPIDLDEIKEAVKQAVALCREEEHIKKIRVDMELKLAENLQLTRNRLITELVSKKLDNDSISEILSIGKLNFSPKENYSVVVLKVKNMEATTNDTNEVLLKIDEVLMNYDVISASGYKNDDHIITIINNKANGQSVFAYDELYRIASSLICALGRFGVVFAGVGKPVYGIGNIHISYQTAVVALQDMFYKGYGRCSVYKETETNSFTFHESNYEEFRGFLENEIKEEIIALITKLTLDVKKDRNTIPNYIKDIYFRLLLTVYDTQKRRGMDLNSGDSQEFLWQTISRYDTLSEMEEYLVAKIHAYFRAIDEARSWSKTASSIMKIVQNEYSDQNMSIKSISNRLFLTDSYLCVIFKRETGKTINQYITEVRVEKAKDLLKDTNMKLFDIARSVGYSDHNYFTKTFKKMTNMPPSEYRERYLT